MHRSFKFCTKVRPQSLMVMPKSDGLHSVMVCCQYGHQSPMVVDELYICDVIGNIVLAVQYQGNDRLAAVRTNEVFDKVRTKRETNSSSP